MSDIDIKIDKIIFSKNKFDDTKLLLNVYGKDVNNYILNSLRKVCTDQVANYVFDPSYINILRNSSDRDNTKLSLGLSQLVIPNIKFDNKYIPKEFYNNIEEFPEEKINIEYYLKKKNTEPESIETVDTNDLIISINDERIPVEQIYNKNMPHALCKLKYNQEIELSMKCKLGNGEINGIYNSAHVYFVDLYTIKEELKKTNELIDIVNKEKLSSKKLSKINPDSPTTNYLLTIVSSGQLNEIEILKRGIELIIIKSEMIKKDINESYALEIGDSTKITFDFENEDFTCIGQLNYLLQEDKDVIYSGASKPNLLEKRINLVLTVKEGKNIVEILNRNIDKSIQYYKKILKLVNEII